MKKLYLIYCWAIFQAQTSFENMWWKLKNTILQESPESGALRNNKKDCYQYEKAEETAWKNIPSFRFEACVESMPRRVKSVIDAKGRYTKY